MRSSARSLITAILALVGGILLSGSSVLADYSVDFGVETDAGKDASSLMCLFGQTCSATMELLGFRATIYIVRGDLGRASVHLYGGDFSCCYFDGATDPIFIDPRVKLSRLPFFKGPRARGGLYIQNERVGTLYLRFRFR